MGRLLICNNKLRLNKTIRKTRISYIRGAIKPQQKDFAYVIVEYIFITMREYKLDVQQMNHDT